MIAFFSRHVCVLGGNLRFFALVLCFCAFYSTAVSGQEYALNLFGNVTETYGVMNETELYFPMQEFVRLMQESARPMEYDADNGLLSFSGKTFSLSAGANSYSINGMTVLTNQPPLLIINDIPMIQLRFIVRKINLIYAFSNSDGMAYIIDPAQIEKAAVEPETTKTNGDAGDAPAVIPPIPKELSSENTSAQLESNLAAESVPIYWDGETLDIMAAKNGGQFYIPLTVFDGKITGDILLENVNSQPMAHVEAVKGKLPLTYKWYADKGVLVVNTERYAEANRSEFPYYIKVVKSQFTMHIYGLDDFGEYTVPIAAHLTSIGKTNLQTPVGKHKITSKQEWKLWSNNVYSRYNSAYNNGLFIHSVLFNGQDVNAPTSSPESQVGSKSTSGCLRVHTDVAEWVFDNCPVGTVIEIVN